MLSRNFSRIGSAFVLIYTVFFVYAVWSAIQACPGFLCDILLLLATIPGSLVFEPQYNIFDIARPSGAFGRYGISTVFFAINATALYFFGAALGRWFGTKKADSAA
jgi:hypothetical protein